MALGEKTGPPSGVLRGVWGSGAGVPCLGAGARSGALPDPWSRQSQLSDTELPLGLPARGLALREDWSRWRAGGFSECKAGRSSLLPWNWLEL